MQLSSGFGFGEGAFEGFVAADGASFEGFIDADDFLVDDAPGSDVLVADFAIAHDSWGDADVETAGGQFGPGPILAEIVGYRRIGQLDGVERVVFGIVIGSPAIADDEEYGSFAFAHCCEIDLRKKSAARRRLV